MSRTQDQVQNIARVLRGHFFGKKIVSRNSQDFPWAIFIGDKFDFENSEYRLESELSNPERQLLNPIKESNK